MYMCDPPEIYPSLSEYTPLFNKCICATLPESTPLSQNIRPFSTNVYVRPSQNLPLSLRIYAPFQQMYMCDTPKIYLSLLIYAPLFNKCICATLPESTPSLFTNYMRPSQNLPLPPRIYPPFQQMYMCDPPRIYASLSVYTLFSTTMCNPSRIYPSLLEYTPPFSTTIILCDPSRIDPSLLPGYTPPFSTTIILCDPPRVYPSLSEYTPLCNKCICVTLPGSTPPSQNIPPPLFNNYMRPSQTLPLPPKYTPFQQMYMCDP